MARGGSWLILATYVGPIQLPSNWLKTLSGDKILALEAWGQACWKDSWVRYLSPLKKTKEEMACFLALGVAAVWGVSPRKTEKNHREAEPGPDPAAPRHTLSLYFCLVGTWISLLSKTVVLKFSIQQNCYQAMARCLMHMGANTMALAFEKRSFYGNIDQQRDRRKKLKLVYPFAPLGTFSKTSRLKVGKLYLSTGTTLSGIMRSYCAGLGSSYNIMDPCTNLGDADYSVLGILASWRQRIVFKARFFFLHSCCRLAETCGFLWLAFQEVRRLFTFPLAVTWDLHLPC